MSHPRQGPAFLSLLILAHRRTDCPVSLLVTYLAPSSIYFFLSFLCLIVESVVASTSETCCRIRTTGMGHKMYPQTSYLILTSTLTLTRAHHRPNHYHFGPPTPPVSHRTCHTSSSSSSSSSTSSSDTSNPTSRIRALSRRRLVLISSSNTSKSSCSFSTSLFSPSVSFTAASRSAMRRWRSLSCITRDVRGVTKREQRGAYLCRGLRGEALELRLERLNLRRLCADHVAQRANQHGRFRALPCSSEEKEKGEEKTRDNEKAISTLSMKTHLKMALLKRTIRSDPRSMHAAPYLLAAFNVHQDHPSISASPTPTINNHSQ